MKFLIRDPVLGRLRFLGLEPGEATPDAPGKATRKSVDARWTVKFRQGKEGCQDIAIPVSGYKSHIALDRRYGSIRACAATDATRPPEDHQQT